MLWYVFSHKWLHYVRMRNKWRGSNPILRYRSNNVQQLEWIWIILKETFKIIKLVGCAVCVAGFGKKILWSFTNLHEIGKQITLCFFIVFLVASSNDFRIPNAYYYAVLKEVSWVDFVCLHTFFWMTPFLVLAVNRNHSHVSTTQVSHRKNKYQRRQIIFIKSE